MRLHNQTLVLVCGLATTGLLNCGGKSSSDSAREMAGSAGSGSWTSPSGATASGGMSHPAGVLGNGGISGDGGVYVVGGTLTNGTSSNHAGASAGSVAGGTGSSAGGATGNSGGASTAGETATSCCDTYPNCKPGDTQLRTNAACPNGLTCYSVSRCCREVRCAPAIPQCDARPECEAGHRVVETCSSDAACYTKSLCNVTITCESAANCCNPPAERQRNYVGASPAQCQAIRFSCVANTTVFSNACGCGCEQSSTCPASVYCGTVGTYDPHPLCVAFDQCPYTERTMTLAECDVKPVCDNSCDSELTGVCPSGGSCYTRTSCGRSIACRFANVTCNPEKENHRKYLGSSPEQCADVGFVCPEHTTMFGNSCGCGCEQPLTCPTDIDCSVDSLDTNTTLCGAQAECPYTRRIWAHDPPP